MPIQENLRGRRDMFICAESERRVNPDTHTIFESPFILRKDSTPAHLHPVFGTYQFHRATLSEVLASKDLTQNAWPGREESTPFDLTAEYLVNSPMGGAYTKEGDMIAYTRLLWGMDNSGKPEIHSHLTAVSDTVRDGGVGESLKWFARQMALEFPETPVDQLSVTFDNLQGRASHVNLNKIGIVCGAAGGIFRENTYGALTGAQDRGNPTDRYQGRWYLDSDWTMAHLEERVTPLTVDFTHQIPPVIEYDYTDLPVDGMTVSIPTPRTVDTDQKEPYLALPIPLDWDGLLRADRHDGFTHANNWRKASRTALTKYHGEGYTTIAQVTDQKAGVNLQILAHDFDPYNPPSALLQ